MNDIRDEEFDRLFKDKLNSFTADLPQNMWDRISSELVKVEEEGRDEGKVIPFVPAKKPLRYIRWHYAAAIALLLGIGAVWMNRPKEVIYLNAGKRPQQQSADQVGTATKESMDKQLLGGQYAQANSGEEENAVPAMGRQEKKAVASTVRQPVGKQEEKVHMMELVDARPVLTHNTTVQPVAAPDVVESRKEPIVIEENTYAMLDAAPEEPIVVEEIDAGGKKNFDVSHVLNYVVGVVDKGEDKVLAFKRDDEGSISIALNFRSLRKKKQEYIN